MGAAESDSVKSARKAKDKLHKACERVVSSPDPTLSGRDARGGHETSERASETREQTLHGQNKTMRMACTRESRDSDQFSSQHTSTHCCAEGLVFQCLSL